MQKITLQKIIQNKLNWINKRKKVQPLSQIKNKINTSTRKFKKSIKNKKTSLILELKKSSPSEGIIRKDFDINKISKIYKKYASAVSVLTDENFFQGNFEYIPQVKSIITQPVLCKDFFIDIYQVYLARYYQSDAILLILSILNDMQYTFLYNTAKNMKMNIITEVNNEIELKRALYLPSEIIGINNRNLNDFSIDISKTEKIAPLIPKKKIIISESGIINYNIIQRLKKYVNGFLIGTAIMKKKDIESSINSLIFGKNKICGIKKKTMLL